MTIQTIHIKKPVLYLLLLGLLDIAAYGQLPEIPDRPLEKFSLSTDRELYISGEKIWFSVLEHGAMQDTSFILSKVLYVELFDESNKVISSGKFHLADGLASGTLQIPPEQPNGVCFLRAYTRYLRNFGATTFPLKPLTIINPTIPLSKKPGDETQAVVLRPGGGRLVAGIPAHVAFRLPDEMISRVKSISLVEQNSTVIETARYYENGLGGVDFVPDGGKNYALRISLDSINVLNSSLPPVDPSGFSMSFTEEKDELVYSMQKSTTSPFTANKRYYLRVSGQNLEMLYNDSLSGVSPLTEFRIRKELLPEGLLYFYLTNEHAEMLDFCLYYNLPSQPLQVGITPSGKLFAPGEQVSLQLDIPGMGDGDLATVTVAVAKKGSVRKINKLLPRWLIDNPLLFSEAYLQHPMPDDTLLDQLTLAFILFEPSLLKQNDLISAIQSSTLDLSFIPEIRKASISGYVKNKQKDLPVAGSRVLLSYIGDHTEIHVNETQDDGSFVFPLEPYHSRQDLFLCTFDEHPGQEILITNDFSNLFPSVPTIPIELDTSHRRLLEEMYINRQVQQLRQAKNQAWQETESTYRLGFGTPDISIRLEDYIDLPSMEVVLNEIVPYVKVRKRKGNYRLTILDSETGLSYENHLILVDNIPVDNLNELMQIYPAQVEKVDVINRTYILGDHTFQGILMVTTYTENFGGITLPMDAVFLKYPLFDANMSFSGPGPQASGKESNYPADLRNTLYWNPGLSLSKTNSLSFYASDHPSDYEIRIEGITRSGKKVFGTRKISIRPAR